MATPGFLTHLQPTTLMLRWSLTFLLFGLIAGLLGFTTVAGTAVGIAKILFFIFAVLFVLTLVLGLFTANKLTK
jgi:uncharacterized membrane protein YtjA (UPF0391 family)